MIYGAILQKGEQYYTDLSGVFKAIGERQCEYNWLITDCICYPKDHRVGERLGGAYCWLTGRELTDIVKADHFQWIWAVLSGFEEGIASSDVLKYPLPYADGCTGFWKNPISIQHPLATLEIVALDSSLTLIFSRKKELADSFMRAFPLSEELTRYNEEEVSLIR